MNNNNPYLIPANTKKGNLIFNIFQPVDLTIFLVGVGLTLLLLVLMSTLNIISNPIITILTLLPGLIAVALVFPFPNYHNIRIALGEVIHFYTNRQRYVWRGWCSSYEFKNK